MGRLLRAKFQVFVSSTFGDLREEREAVSWEILKAGHIPAGMESFPATDDRGWKIIKRTIDDCDYYIVVVAGRYGSVDTSTGISWTEREYEYARAKGMPVLPFVRERKSITGDKIDTGENATKLDAFMKKLGSNHLYQTFTNREDLAAKVAASIHRAIQIDEEDATTRSGWIRGDAIPPNALEELARLSKENASLREKVEALGESKKAVFELLLDGKPLPPTLPIEIPQYRLVPDARRNVAGTFSAITAAMSRRETLADACGRLVWLDLSLRNGGTGIARNVVATITARSVRQLQLHRLSVSDLTDLIPRWITNPAEHVYVDRNTTTNNIATVQQRIRTLGIGQTERLIRMGFVLEDDFSHAGTAELNVDFEVRSEEGECSTGAARVDVSQGPEKEITEEELEEL